MSGEINRRLEQLSIQLEQKKLLDEGYRVFKDVTPIDQGNAKRSTRKQGSDTIHADYAYAGRLNRGWSNQAKTGMAKPTIEHLQKYIKSVGK
ncbi:hypothetical protein UFOVP758_24 [uncultured Caudovirales phage]|uniref:Uncharacterized protein n=1 Tax=uncultured Caudovirales phage TaxID=2100421 RepID=A0A6J7X5I5_9CAUD|nr:hypothetical protein UFOVP758_24 [uncultured Caudovirales phage]